MAPLTRKKESPTTGNTFRFAFKKSKPFMPMALFHPWQTAKNGAFVSQTTQHGAWAANRAWGYVMGQAKRIYGALRVLIR